jgi:hypothetical protein
VHKSLSAYLVTCITYINKSRPVYVTLLLTVVFIISEFSSPNNFIAGGDYGEYVNNAYRVLGGDRPYQDFWLLFPPGEVYLPAFLCHIFGDRLVAIPISFKIFKILAGLLSFRLARKIGNNINAILTAILIYTNLITLINIYLIPLLAACLFIFNYFEDISLEYDLKQSGKNLSRVYNLLIAGFFIALTFSIRFELASVFLVAVAITIICDRYLIKNYSYDDSDAHSNLNSNLLNIDASKINDQQCVAVSVASGYSKCPNAYTNKIIKYINNEHQSNWYLLDLLVLLLGFGTTLGIMAIAAHDFFREMLPAIFIDALKHGTSLNLPYFYSIYAVEVPTSLAHAELFRYLNWIIPKVIKYLFPFGLAIPAAYVLYQNFLIRPAANMSVLLVSWAFLSFPRALGRSESGYLTYALFPLFILAPYLLMFLWRNVQSSTNTQLQSFNPLISPSHPSADVLAPSRASTRAAALHKRLILLIAIPLAILFIYSLPRSPRLSYQDVVQVDTPAGQFAIEKTEAAQIRSILHDIETYTQPGEPIFVTPFTLPFYALSQRTNPTYYDSLIDLYALPTRQKQERVCDQLVAGKPRLIVHNDAMQIDFDGNHTKNFADGLPILHECLQANYTLLHNYGNLATYVSK